MLFSKDHFKADAQRKSWLDQQQDKLLNMENGVEQVIQTLQQVRAKSQSVLSKQKAIDYFLEHEDRMQYKTYKDKGLLIGSGPIEAAHRCVIQQMLKRSGQKWSIRGANAMATLRCYNKSNNLAPGRQSHYARRVNISYVQFAIHTS